MALLGSPLCLDSAAGWRLLGGVSRWAPPVPADAAMKLRITRTDVVHVEPARGSPLEHASPADQLAAFRKAFTQSLFDDTVGAGFETSDGEWEYDYVDHEQMTVGFVPANRPALQDEEP
jgi:hypothetical protein